VTLTAPTVEDPARSPIRALFGRRKFDKQPSQPAKVLIAAASGDAFPRAAFIRAAELAGQDGVAVVTIARIYGSSLGLPNPGLMPTRREMAAQKEHVEAAIAELERRGLVAWGQIAASRKPAKTIAEVARARGVDHVVVVRHELVRWREIVEGDVVKEISRKLGSAVAVEGVSP
jgi:nucleotide-binding universal stress UspA family protein